MLDHGDATRPRPRPRRLAGRRLPLRAESLESRRLLDASATNMAAGLTFGLALPGPGIAPLLSVVSPAQAIAPGGSMSFGPSATGPSTTLSPLANDSETAIATASEVARPTPGRSDRSTSAIEAPDILRIIPIEAPDPVVVVPGPEIRAVPTIPAPAPAEPARPIDAAPAPAPAPVPAPAPEVPKDPVTLAAWDAAIEIVAAEDVAEAPPASPVHRVEVAMAAGALMAAWGGWRFGSRLDGRSRERSPAIAAVDPGN